MQFSSFFLLLVVAIATLGFSSEARRLYAPTCKFPITLANDKTGFLDGCYVCRYGVNLCLTTDAMVAGEECKMC